MHPPARAAAACGGGRRRALRNRTASLAFSRAPQHTTPTCCGIPIHSSPTRVRSGATASARTSESDGRLKKMFRPRRRFRGEQRHTRFCVRWRGRCQEGGGGTRRTRCAPLATVRHSARERATGAPRAPARAPARRCPRGLARGARSAPRAAGRVRITQRASAGAAAAEGGSSCGRPRGGGQRVVGSSPAISGARWRPGHPQRAWCRRQHLSPRTRRLPPRAARISRLSPWAVARHTSTSLAPRA